MPVCLCSNESIMDVLGRAEQLIDLIDNCNCQEIIIVIVMSIIDMVYNEVIRNYILCNSVVFIIFSDLIVIMI